MTSALRELRETGPWSLGRSLRDVLAQGERPDRATLIDWGAQLLEILAEAHATEFFYGSLTEDQVFLTPQGRLFVASSGLPPEEPLTVRGDLYAAGCLLRRLAFASVRGGRGLGARDPLVKVLARATFPGPGTRYESAAEMAEALREAGRQEMAGPQRLEPQTGASARVAKFPSAASKRISHPSSLEALRSRAGEGGALWHALVLLVMSLLLMTFLLVTGGIILHRDAPAWRSGDLSSPLTPPLAAH